jgi:hypothetical protein
MDRNLYFIAGFLFSLTCISQNNQILYDFDEIPQTLILNPGSTYSHDYFIGIPILSGITFSGGLTGLTAYDILADDGRDINNKISDVIYSLGNDDSVVLNEKVDIISAGIRLGVNDFLSFGLYQELDFSFYYPTDIIKLFYEGTANLNKQYSMDGVNFKADMVGVLHAGISHKVNEKFIIGGRLKFYSSVFNAQTKNNTGQFYTSLGTDNIYRHHLVGVETLIQTAGLTFEEGEEVERKDFTERIDDFDNRGVGFDIGFTYKFNDQVHITGSLLDVGFVKNSNDISTYYARGNYEIEGLEFQFDEDVPQDYWQEFLEDFENKLPIDTLYTSYNSYRPIKVNASLKYSFGKPHYEDCFYSNADDPYRNAIGLQLFSVNRIIKPQSAITLFYERRFGKVLRSKFTYTVDAYSSKNIGVGLSSKFGPINIYLAIDNLLYLENITKANSASFQFGINFIIDKKFP